MATGTGERQWWRDRGMAVGLAAVLFAVALNLALGQERVPLTAVVIGPVLAAIVAPPLAAVGVTVVASTAVVLLGLREDMWGSGGVAWRLAIVLLAGALAVWSAVHRTRREAVLSQAQTVADLASRLSLALDAAQLGTWQWDLGRGLLSWDRHAATLLQPAQAAEGTWREFTAAVHPDDVDGLYAALEHAIATGGPVSREFRVRRAGGEERRLATRGQVLGDGAGRPARVVGVLLDRTEARSHAERIADTLEAIDEAFFAVDRSWRFTYVNGRAEALMRRTRSELLGRTYWEAYPDGLGGPFEDHYRWAMASGERLTFEAWSSVAKAWLEVRAYPGPDGLSVYFRDVTARREADQLRAQRLASEQRARQAADRILDVAARLGGEVSAREVADAACPAALELFGCGWAALWAVEGDRLRLVTEAGRRAFEPGTVVAVDDVSGMPELVRAAHPAFIPDVRAVSSPAGRERAARLGARSALRVPIILDGAVDGVLAVTWDEVVESFDAAMMLAAQRFGDQVSLALQRARTRAAQAEAAALGARLQAGLLPSLAVAAEDVSVATVYRPGERRMLLGGDFVDVIELADGSLAFVIGDVTGHGPRAAARGTTLRAGWRALALAGQAPAAVVAALDALLQGEEPSEDALATVCCGWLDADRRRLRVVLAGHPPPVLVTDDAVRPLHLASGLLLGCPGDERCRPVGEVELPARWALLSYTDGLTEARIDPVGRERLELRGVLARLAALGGPEALDAEALDGLLQRIEREAQAPFADDVALLLLRHS